MSVMRFNAITYSNRLKEAGLDKKIADVQAEELSNIINNDLATKHDINMMQQDMKLMKNELIIKLGGIAIACSTIMTTILGFIIKY